VSADLDAMATPIVVDDCRIATRREGTVYESLV
jgi:hypothetical protein